MSVILDALRRTRGPSRAPSGAAPPGIPSALRGRPAPKRPSKRGATRWLTGIVVLAGVVWAAVQYGPLFLRRSAPTTAVVTTPPRAAEPAPAAPAPKPDTREQTAKAIDEIVRGITKPAELAPRAMPGTPARAGRAASSGRAAPSGRSTPVRRAGVPSRPPLPAAPVPALTSPAAAAAAPTPAVNHFDLAVVYHRLGNFEQALMHYTAALQAEEFNVEARNNLGLLYHERGLANEAIDQFRRAILIKPQYLTARSNLAVVLLNAGRLAEARAELRAALDIDARNVDLLVNMALVDKADRQPEVARETLIRALSLQASHAAAHYNLAILYDEAGELARAQDHYSDFLKYAGPEYGTRLSDVQRRIDLIAPRLTPPQP